MAIKIARVGEKYSAELTPPHGDGGSWSTTEPLQINELIRELLARHCHQTDIGDALYEADEGWVNRLEVPPDAK